MNDKKKKIVNKKLREIQLIMWDLHSDGLILYEDVIKVTKKAQELKYDLGDV